MFLTESLATVLFLINFMDYHLIIYFIYFSSHSFGKITIKSRKQRGKDYKTKAVNKTNLVSDQTDREKLKYF